MARSPYIRFAPILALVGVGVNRIGKLHCTATGTPFPSQPSDDPHFGGLTTFGRPFGKDFHHPDTPSPVFSTLPSISSAYAGTGLRRRSSIKANIFWNKIFDTATSASWNVT